MTIGKKLKTVRVKLGYTQEQVAEKLFVSRQTISNWENEKFLPDIISIIKISDLYNISLDELFKGDEKMLKKIEDDTAVVKQSRRVLIVGWTMIFLAAVLSLTDLLYEKAVIDFITAAIVWILLGVGIAIVCAYSSKNKKRYITD